MIIRWRMIMVQCPDLMRQKATTARQDNWFPVRLKSRGVVFANAGLGVWGGKGVGGGGRLPEAIHAKSPPEICFSHNANIDSLTLAPRTDSYYIQESHLCRKHPTGIFKFYMEYLWHVNGGAGRGECQCFGRGCFLLLLLLLFCACQYIVSS